MCNFDLDICSGTLYIVSTPIGNLEDITYRAVKILSQVDIILAEDTRHTGKLCKHYNIKSKFISCNEHNESFRLIKVVELLKQGKSLAIVSDAGTPGISDPGYRLIKELVLKGVKVIPIPGVSAAITGLSVSGFPTDSFVFEGFLSPKKNKRFEHLKKIEKEKRTIILYESPKKIVSLLEDMKEILGDRRIVLSREMTKLHEEFIRGTISEVIIKLEKKINIKGEFTLIIYGNEDKKEPVDKNSLIEYIKKELENNKSNKLKPSIMAKNIAKKFALSKSEVYDEIMKLKK